MVMVVGGIVTRLGVIQLLPARAWRPFICSPAPVMWWGPKALGLLARTGLRAVTG